MARILILEYQIEVADTIKGMLEDHAHEVEVEMSPAHVMEKIDAFQPELITLDISFSEPEDETGIDLLQKIRQKYSKNQLPIIAVSGYVNADKLTRMMNLGCKGYIVKPVKQDELLKKVTECLESTKSLNDKVSGPWTLQMTGNSSAILELIVSIDKAAKAETGLLILGENGAGKDMVVNKYRELSPRKNNFVFVDCVVIPTELFETEIFGHERGAFANAIKDKPGLIEGAQGGIVFFDEIGDLPDNQQQKLLQLVQHKTFRRVGSNTTRKLDAIILAATNRDLAARVEEGKFRRDLYFRLKNNIVEMPPLRKHKEDIPYLVEYFVRKYNQECRKNIQAVDAELLERFKVMQWQGNVRELENCILHGVVKCDGRTLKWQDVEMFFKNDKKASSVCDTPIDYRLSYTQFKNQLDKDREDKEKKYYLYHLEQNQWNKSKTAKEIEVDRTYLEQIIKRLGIKKPDAR